jgi:cysteinyl-tRNA synthetase
VQEKIINKCIPSWRYGKGKQEFNSTWTLLRPGWYFLDSIME